MTFPFPPSALVKASAVVGIGENDENCIMLLHCDDAGLFPVKDSSAGGHWVSKNGGLTYSTSTFKFGVASLQFDGSTSFAQALDNFYDLAFGTGDFTIDFWINIAGISEQKQLIDFRPGGTQGIYPTLYISAPSALKLTYFVNVTGVIVGTTTLTTGVWYHVALVRSGNQTKLYLNGVQEGSTYTDTNNYLNGNNRPLIGINGYDAVNNCFNGFMDEIRLSNVARWTANFTPPTTAYRIPAGAEWFTKLLCHCDGPNAQVVISESSNVGHFASGFGGAGLSTTQAKFGATSMAFSGTSYLYFAPYQDLVFSTNDFTVEFWFRTTSSTNQALADARYAGTQWTIFLNAVGTISFLVGSSAMINSTTTISANTWYHVAVARSGTQTKMFINGVQEGSTYTDNNNYVDSGAQRPLFGVSGNDGTSFPFQGFMDEIRITRSYARYTANFTPQSAPFSGRPGQNDSFTKLLIHFGGGAGAAQICDSSPSGHPLGSGATMATNANSQKKFGLCSGSFAAASPNSVSAIDPSTSTDWAFGTGDFTLETWIYLSDVRAEYVIDFIPAGANGTYPALYMKADQTPSFLVADSFQISTSTIMTLATWHHLAVARAGGLTKLFLDGTQVGSTYTDNNNYVGPPGGSYRPVIGLGGLSGGAAFNGYLDEVRFSKGIARWTANFTPPTAPYA